MLLFDPEVKWLADGDVHIRQGEIAAVGPSVEAPEAEEIDARALIVMPGLIDTHWHLWNSLLRALCSTEPQRHYFPTLARYGPLFQPGHTYWATRLALAEAVNGGITTVADWAHNVRGPESADASLRAHVDSGLRTRLYYSYCEGQGASQVMDLDDVRRVKEQWIDSGRAPLTSLGVGLRNPATHPDLDWRQEWGVARELGLPLSTHVADRSEADVIVRLASEGWLGPDLQLVHGIDVTPDERKLLATEHCSLSVTPWTELLIGFGYPDIAGMIEDGITTSLATDTVALSGSADLFSVMRAALSIAHASARREDGLSPERVLRMATIDAARDLGLEEVTGSLSPGKRADVIALRRDAINTAPCVDPVNLAVLAAQPSNVDLVIADGRVLKRDAVLLSTDTREIAERATRNFADLVARAQGVA